MTKKIAVAGAMGKMGRELLVEILEHEACTLSGVLLNPSSEKGKGWLGKDAAFLVGKAECGVALSDDAQAVLQKTDILIDFTPASPRHALLCAASKTTFICGATGLGQELQSALDKAAREITVVFAANFSLGIAVLSDLIVQAKTQLGEAYDIEILEMHHRDKRDAPSGTALYLGERLEEKANPPRAGKRAKGGIGYAVLRGGDVVGEHQVIFAGHRERLILSHKAEERRVFAAGAVKAALWSDGKAPGLYSMRDVVLP